MILDGLPPRGFSACDRSLAERRSSPCDLKYRLQLNLARVSACCRPPSTTLSTGCRHDLADIPRPGTDRGLDEPITDLVRDAPADLADAPAAWAMFKAPSGVAMDSTGKHYVADVKNHMIRVVHKGQVTTLAGSGTAGFADGAAAVAKFNSPIGVAVDSAGKVYVADQLNHRIRVVHNGQVTTLAGSGMDGFANGTAASAMFDTPFGVAVDGAGKVYVADKMNHRIRVVHNGQVTTLAGSGSGGYLNGASASAKFNRPIGVAVDGAGKVYVGDQFNNVIRIINP